MTLQLAYKQLLAQLYNIYETREAANIADWVIEHVTGQKKIDRILYKDLPVSIEQQQRLETITSQLLQNKPVQYVLNEAWFCNLKLYVNEHVLIPRPETEELVDWMVKEIIEKKDKRQNSILDIGTGSGCIAIALKKKLNNIDVHAVDTSSEALKVATKNATEQEVCITLLEMDFLDKVQWNTLPKFNVIVSNPPYVKESEMQTISRNVLKFEPHIALFVPDEDPLKFYKGIAAFAQSELYEDGSIFVEINEALAPQVTTLITESGFDNVTLRKDLQGKDRMIKASRY
jgi:release factor glutamine methyltransferase